MSCLYSDVLEETGVELLRRGLKEMMIGVVSHANSKSGHM